MVLAFVAAGPASGQALRYDSSEVAVRTPPDDALASYRADPDYAYDRDEPEGESWWDRFKAWLWETIFSNIFSEEMTPFWRLVLYVVIGLGLLFAILRLLQMDARGLIAGRKARRLDFAELEENLDHLDFDRLIAEAIAAQDYRRAVRLVYLQALRQLADRELIHWTRDKTNHDYLDELNTSALHGPLADLTYVFEYVWYGDFPVDAGSFAWVQKAYGRFTEHLPQPEPVA